MEGGENGSGVKVFVTNAQSIVNKIEELRAMVTVSKPDLIALTETWTHDGIGNEYLQITGYEIIARRDREDTEGGRGGEVIIYANNNLNAREIETKSNFSQYVSIELKCRCEDVFVHAVYRSPNSNSDNDAALISLIKEMRGNNIIIGDLNFPDVNWKNGTAGSKGRPFLDATTEMGMDQHVEEATHTSGNILDLILCNQEGLIREVKLDGRIGKSDHNIITFGIQIDDKRQKTQRMRPNYRKANFKEMRETIAKVDWERELDGQDVNSMWQLISAKLKSAMDTYIPIKKCGSKMQPKWFDGEIKRSIEEKKRAWKKWKEKNTETAKNEYKKAVAGTKKKIRKKKNGLERKIAESRKSNPKLFYSFINSQRKSRAKIGPLNDAITEPKEQAKILNYQYVSVFTQSETDEFEPARKRTESTLEHVDVTEEQVRKEIERLNENSATGPDGIPARVLKELQNKIASPLTILFRKSIASAKIPDEWRDAEVTPIYKKGNKSDPANYRPVSLTSVTGKMLERIVKEPLSEYLENNNLLSNAQHGFRPGRSTQTNLIEYLDKLTKWIDEGRSFDVVYLDFSKAFDVVCHRRLAVKMDAIGISGNLKKWLVDWLKARRQRVRVDDAYLEWAEVVSSVLQGSVLGGILFDIYIDDITDIIVQALASIFADDTKVARIVETEKDGRDMQKIVDELGAWATKWRMAFNADKCKVLHFGKKNPGVKYEMHGQELKEAKEEKDLGVWIDASLKPSKQCATAAKAAHFALGQIQRSFHFRSKHTLVPLYKSFVRPKLEFSVAAWAPWTEADSEVMESVQKRLIRVLLSCQKDNVQETNW